MRRLLPLFALLAACTPIEAPSHPLATIPGEGPQVTVVFEDNMSWPYRVEQLVMTLDGTVVFDKYLDPDSENPSYEIGPMDAAVGQHTLSVHATTAFDDCRVVLRDGHTFALGHEPALVDVRFWANDNTKQFTERATVSFDTRGGTALGGGPPSRHAGDNPACDGRAPLPFSDHDIKSMRDRLRPEPWSPY